MAQIRLSVREAAGEMPPVCLCCGAPATVFKMKKMFWWPRWTYFLLLVHPLLWVLGAFVVGKRMMFCAPFCERHQGHWFKRRVLLWGVGALVTILAFALAFVINSPPPMLQGLHGVAELMVAALVVFWLILIIIVHNLEIHATLITESEIVLTGVSEEFVAAIQEADDEPFGGDDDDFSRNDETDLPIRKGQASSDAIRKERPKPARPDDAFEE